MDEKFITVISKRGCHLCEKVLEALRPLLARYDLELRVLDINDYPQLHDRYWLTIPVVQFDGKDLFNANDIGPGIDFSRELELLLKDSLS